MAALKRRREEVVMKDAETLRQKNFPSHNTCQWWSQHEVKRKITTKWMSMCLFRLIIWRPSPQSRSIHWHGNVTIIVIGTHILTHAWYSWHWTASNTSQQSYEISVYPVAERLTVDLAQPVWYIRCVATGIRTLNFRMQSKRYAQLSMLWKIMILPFTRKQSSKP